MSNNNQPPGSWEARLRALLPYTTIALILAILYVCWTFYSRYENSRDAQRAIEKKKEDERKQIVNDIYGSGEIKFTALAVDSGVLRRGETTRLCYGVVNAKTVKLDPPVEQAKPSYYHCLDIAPKTTTTYTLTAQDAKGNSQSKQITVQVK